MHRGTQRLNQGFPGSGLLRKTLGLNRAQYLSGTSNKYHLAAGRVSDAGFFAGGGPFDFAQGRSAAHERAVFDL